MALKQPVTQVRLTNVAVVRLRQHGHRFEVACYKNKVLNWRAGIEDDLREVLQTNAVFHNVSKGEFAKRDALLAVFNTVDQERICKIILDKGELQVSEKERQAALAAALQDVISLVIEMTVNVRTGLPLTRTAAASALKQAGFGVKLGVASKAQALKAVVLLQRKLGPDAIARRMMRLKAECAAEHRERVCKFVTEQCGGVVEHERLLRGGGEEEESAETPDRREREERAEDGVGGTAESTGARDARRREFSQSQAAGRGQRGKGGDGRDVEEAMGDHSNADTFAGDREERTARASRPPGALERGREAETPSGDSGCVSAQKRSVDSGKRGSEATYSVVFLSPASCYRELDTLLHSVGGSLVLLAANCIQACQPDWRACSSKTPAGETGEGASDCAPRAGQERERRRTGRRTEADAEGEAGQGLSPKGEQAKKRRDAARRNRGCGGDSSEEGNGDACGDRALRDGEEEGKARRKKAGNRSQRRADVQIPRALKMGDSREAASCLPHVLEATARGTQLAASPEDWEAAAMAWLRRDPLAEPLQMRSGGTSRSSASDEDESSEEDPPILGRQPQPSTRKGKKEKRGRKSEASGDRHTLHNGREHVVSLSHPEFHAEASGASPLCSADSLGFGVPASPDTRRSGAGVQASAAQREVHSSLSSHVAGSRERTTFGAPDATGVHRKKEKQAQRGGAFACRTCHLAFDAAADYRQHCKSSLHAMNLKRRVKDLPPLTEEGWREAQLDEQLAVQLEGMVMPEY
uniref:Zinc finger (C2H2 type) domain-containing protein, putative n=1 Tax=Neospora caninum (strain Liverpool) TaxID=572307 RepID=A0A0F7UDM4_NEOCL|nr:TPA: zinc finger (C2H2 type) domain-containing protein, putative [Neospora caninum Liverpool]